MTIHVNFAQMAKKTVRRSYKNRLPRSGVITREAVDAYLTHLQSQVGRLEALAKKMADQSAPIDDTTMDGIQRPGRAIGEMHAFLDDLERAIRKERRERYGLPE